MAKLEVINQQQHKDVRIITDRGANYGEAVHFVPVLADEALALVLEYPLFFMKDESSGQFTFNALLGFEPGENLFLQGKQWNTIYQPVNIRRQPFMVAIKEGSSDEPGKREGALALDMESPRVNTEQGEALFNEDGSNSKFLEHMNNLVNHMMGGVDSTKRYIEALVEKDLLMATKMDVNFASGEKKSFGGLHVINIEKLATLAGEELADFHKRGYLKASYLIQASGGNMQKLIALKNQRDAAAS